MKSDREILLISQKNYKKRFNSCNKNISEDKIYFTLVLFKNTYDKKNKNVTGTFNFLGMKNTVAMKFKEGKATYNLNGVKTNALTYQIEVDDLNIATM